jgi:hypothetical protein
MAFLPSLPGDALAEAWRRIAMARATWNGAVLAETDRAVLLEGNVYFPPYVAFWNGVEVTTTAASHAPEASGAPGAPGPGASSGPQTPPGAAG